MIWAQRNAAYKKRHAEKRAMRGTDTDRKRSGKRKPRIIEFIAVDGEGLTRDDNQHDYVLLAASDNSMAERWAFDGLSTARCFDYLLDLHKRHPKSTLVAFAFGYDTNMMLRDVTRAELERINDGEYTVIAGRYIVKYIAGKSFYVGRGHYENARWKTDVGVTVWDTWGFFQSSFVKALEAWNICPPGVIDIIARMKEKRGEFGDDMQEMITSYCFRECELLVQLMTEFKAVADAAGIKLTRWDGAGACASALLRQHDMKRYIRPEKATPDAVERAALYAYFGGRIEIFGSGVIDGPSYEYDVNSAYPHEVWQLPSMQGVWERVLDTHGRVSLNGLYHVRWSVPQGTVLQGTCHAYVLMGPFPWRDGSGNVLYPLRGEGYYHGVEVEAALAVYGSCIDVLDGYEFFPHSDEKPFDWVRDLYTLRRAYKETGDARAIVLKLALNAMYGKLAQSVGYKRGEPPAYQSYYLAGRVTAGTRAKILHAGNLAGGVIISTMTDALFTRELIPSLQISKELGDWDVKELEPGLLVVQPGVVLTPQTDCEHCNGAGCYRCARGRSMPFGRSRGFYRSSLDYAKARKSWDDAGMFGAFSVVERRFIGMGRALAAVRLAEWNLEVEPEKDVLGNLISEQWRRWLEIKKRVSFRANFERKGTWFDLYKNWASWWPDEGEEILGEIYRPKTVFRTLNAITDQDTVEQPDAIEGTSVGV